MTSRRVGERPARPAFYARTGDLAGDLFALLHPPYTAWHLSYVVYGAVLAPSLDRVTLAGTLVAFLFGTGVAAHALDEWHGHPLATRLSDGALLGIAGAGVAAAGGVALAGAFAVSPWVLAWALAGMLLMMGYTLEWHRALHSDMGFALAWGGFPVLVAYWAQTARIDVAVVLVALAAVLLSYAQRALSTPARAVRRRAEDATVHFDRADGLDDWDRKRLLDTWERPLMLLSSGVVTLAAGLLVMRL